MLIMGLIVTTMLSTLPLYNTASCEQQVELTVTKYDLLIQTKSAEYEKQITQLKVDLKDSEKEKIRSQNKIQQLEKDNNQLTTDWKLSKQMADEKSRAVATLEGEKQQLELAKVQLQGEKTQLENENGKLTAELGGVKEELTKKTEAADTLKTEKWQIELETQKQTAANAVEQNRALADKDKENHELSSEVKVLQSEKSALLGDNKKLEVDLTKTTSSLENLREKHSSLEEELRKYKESYSTKFWERFEIGLDRDGERLSTLMEENQKLKTAVTQAKNEVIKTDSECQGVVCRTLTSGIKNFFG